MSDVKYIYLFFEVNKCSDLVTHARWTGGLPGVAVGEPVVGRPVSVEGLRSDVGWDTFDVTTVDDDRDYTEDSKLKAAYFITCVPSWNRGPEFSPTVFRGPSMWLTPLPSVLEIGDLRLDYVD